MVDGQVSTPPVGAADGARTTTDPQDLSGANYATVWDAVARAVPDRPAVVTEGRTVTYRELEDRASRLAGALAAHGVGPDSTVAIFMYNRVEYLLTLYAAYKLGAVPVNLNFRYRGAELAELLDVSRPRALVYPTSLRTAVLDAAARTPLPDLVLAVPDEPAVDAGEERPAAPAAPGTSFADALTGDPLAPQPLGPDRKIFMFTGGTTGRPKAVVWTHGNLFDSQQFSIYGSLPVTPPRTMDGVTAIAARDDLPRTVCLPLPPMMHATALFNVMNAVVLGGTVVFLSTPHLDPMTVLRTIEQHGVTRLIVAGNAVVGPLVAALDSPEGADIDISSISTVLSSGMAWSDELKRRLVERAHGATLIDIVGASEGGPFAYGVVRSPADLPCRPRLAPGAVVLDEDLQEVQGVVGAVGRLAYRGAMPLGYHGDPVRTEEAYPTIRGVRHVMPGDYVRVLDDHHVELLGRGSGVVNTGGEKVYPGEVEEAILELDDVVDAVVFGLPDDRWGETVTAMVAVRPGSTLTEDDVRAEVGRRLAGYKKPRTVLLVDRLVRSPSGKLDMRSLKQHALTRLSGPAPRTAPTPAPHPEGTP